MGHDFNGALGGASSQCWGVMRSVLSRVGGGGAIDASASGAMQSLLAISLSIFYFPGMEII